LLDCGYINDMTNWMPSCSATQPASALVDCDCFASGCQAVYNHYDTKFQPTGIYCVNWTYFSAVYFTVVTISTLGKLLKDLYPTSKSTAMNVSSVMHTYFVLTMYFLREYNTTPTTGYGDFAPDTELSRLVVCGLIIVSLVLIPMQVNQLAVSLAAISPFRRKFRKPGDASHVILCGHVNDRGKVERFLKEFYHPTKIYVRDQDIKVLLLCPAEPCEDIKAMMQSVDFGNLVSYLVGSALSMDDLKKAGVHYAKAVFFMCNPYVDRDEAKLEDAANILRALSMTNFNPSLECYVQLLTKGDRDVMKNWNVDVVLCLDEYRTAMQARNATCPGLSTMIENLFITFGNLASAGEDDEGIGSGDWSEEYTHGAEMEVYYIKLGRRYMESLSYIWSLMVEGIYLEFGIMMIGVCSPENHAMVLNPTIVEMKEAEDGAEFFDELYMGVLICDDYEEAARVERALEDEMAIRRILSKLVQGSCKLIYSLHDELAPDISMS
jgi:Calcium-activated BK potassium channel alpha subunit/TrkA-N domain/Ion channel